MTPFIFSEAQWCVSWIVCCANAILVWTKLRNTVLVQGNTPVCPPLVHSWCSLILGTTYGSLRTTTFVYFYLASFLSIKLVLNCLTHHIDVIPCWQCVCPQPLRFCFSYVASDRNWHYLAYMWVLESSPFLGYIYSYTLCSMCEFDSLFRVTLNNKGMKELKNTILAWNEQCICS